VFLSFFFCLLLALHSFRFFSLLSPFFFSYFFFVAAIGSASVMCSV
jgi:hypothetical protein